MHDQDAGMYRRPRTRCDRDEVGTVLCDQYAVVGDRKRIDRCIAGTCPEGADVDDPLDIVTSGAESVQK